MSFAPAVAFLSVDPASIRNDLKGEWIYQFSLIDGKEKQIPSDTHCPVYKMIFSECKDAKDMKINSPVVINMRKTNVLKDLKCRSYRDSSKLIDTFFPVLHFSKNDSVSGSMVLNYGNKLKSEYFIDKLSADTLVIYDGKVHTIENRKYHSVRHTYYRKKK
jgi:hypothetical protein